MQKKFILEDLHQLCHDIGSRPAGSLTELAAAEFMAEKFRQYGATSTAIERFMMQVRKVKSESLEVCLNGVWQKFPALMLSGSPGTGGQTLETEAVIFYAAVDFQRQDLGYLHDKAVILYGTDYTPQINYRRLMEAKPAFLVFADSRYPKKAPVAESLIPHYVEQYGAVPSVSVGLLSVWEWMQNNLSRIRLNIDGGSVPGESVNVVAEYPGNDPDAGIIIIGSHLDSQVNTAGADDNASGMVFQLALARILKDKKLRHTVRYISFGTEEQLSVGSAAYVRQHSDEIKKHGKFMINADSCGTLLGWNEVTCCASPDVWLAFETLMNKYGCYGKVSFAPTPFIDLMPFNACGVPGLWINRHNCTAGRFQHHRPSDSVEMISPAVISTHAAAVAEFILQIDRKELEIPPLSAAMQSEIGSGWQEFFGEKIL